MNQADIKSRVTAREQSRAIAGLAIEEVAKLPQESQGAFWDELKKMLPFPRGTQEAWRQEAMSDRQSRAFGNSRIPFGEFRGTRIDEVPLERLQWYADLSPFQKQLQRYLASARIRGEDEEQS